MQIQLFILRMIEYIKC